MQPHRTLLNDLANNKKENLFQILKKEFKNPDIVFYAFEYSLELSDGKKGRADFIAVLENYDHLIICIMELKTDLSQSHNKICKQIEEYASSPTLLKIAEEYKKPRTNYIRWAFLILRPTHIESEYEHFKRRDSLDYAVEEMLQKHPNYEIDELSPLSFVIYKNRNQDFVRYRSGWGILTPKIIVVPLDDIWRREF